MVHQGRLLCEDCYIKAIWPKTRTVIHENGSTGFFARLKRNWTVIKQKFD